MSASSFLVSSNSQMDQDITNAVSTEKTNHSSQEQSKGMLYTLLKTTTIATRNKTRKNKTPARRGNVIMSAECDGLEQHPLHKSDQGLYTFSLFIFFNKVYLLCQTRLRAAPTRNLPIMIHR